MKLNNNILRYGIFAGLAVVPFVPLIVTSSMFFPFITGKNFLFRIIVLVITALWLILMVKDSSVRPKGSLILWGTLSLLIITTLATIFGLNPYRSFWSNFERMDGLITQIHLFLYFIVLTSVLTTRQYWYRFFKLNLFVAFCLSIYAASQLLGFSDIHQGGVRIDATLGNAAYLAVYLLINLFLSLYLSFVSTKEGWWRFVYFSLAGWFTVLLYFTQTRGTILGLIGGLFVFGLLLAIRGQGRIRRVALGIIAGVVILVGLFFVFKDSSLIKNNQTLNRFASISLSEKTTISRFTIWGMSLKAVAEHPVLGWGPENYIYIFSKYYVPSLWQQEPWFDRSHNVFLDWLVTAGVLGLVAYLFLFGAAIYYLVKFGLLKRTGVYNQDEIIGSSLLIALLFAYLCHNFFVFDNLVSYILFFSLLGYIHTLAVENKQNIGGRKVMPEFGRYVFNTIIVVSALGVFYIADFKPIRASVSLIQAMTSSSVETKLTEFKKVFDLNTFGSKEALEQYLTSVVSSILSNQNISLLTKQAFGQLAIDQIDQQLKSVGPDARSYIIFGSFMSNVGRFTEATNYLNLAKKYSPQKQIVYFQLASVYINQRDFSKALEEVKKAYELDSSYPEAVIMYSLVSIYSGNYQLADQILSQWHNEEIVIKDERLITAYTYMKRMDKVNEILLWRTANLEKLIETDPRNVDNYFTLVGVWQKLGRAQEISRVLQRLTVVLNKEIKESPDQKDLYLNLARAYYYLGNYQKVDETIKTIIGRYEEKIKINPRLSNNYTVIAEIYTEAGRSDLAKQVLERAATVIPSFRYQAAELINKLPSTSSPAASLVE